MSSISSLFSSECKFVAGAAVYAQIPYLKQPEIAFVGRSNVGKSSLINALIGKTCARVSKTPGRTQQINFFSLGNKISLVDLPGYGYAAVSKQTRMQWDDLVLNYLKYRKNLVRVFLLIDSKLGVKQNDEEIMKIFDTLGLVFQVVLTKSDKKSRGIEDAVKEIIKLHPAAFPEIVSTSSKERNSVKKLQADIYQLISKKVQA